MSKICVHYSAGSKTDAVSLDMYIHFSKFDPVKGLVKVTSHDEAVINRAIRKVSDLLQCVAFELPEEEFKSIKQLYKQRCAELKQQQSENNANAAKPKPATLCEDMKKRQANLKLQEKIEALQQKISKLQEKQALLKTSVA